MHRRTTRGGKGCALYVNLLQEAFCLDGVIRCVSTAFQRRIAARSGAWGCSAVDKDNLLPIPRSLLPKTILILIPILLRCQHYDNEFD
ncbi:hypothetical protein GQ44DRAFT_825079, partial [Phaeosphaeriaceae sp. PMI808]